MSGAAEKEKNIKQLRKQAEKKSGGKIVKLSGLSVKNTSRLIQELRVHQIEMEMQNDELRKVQKELEDSRNRYFGLFDFAPVGYFTLNQKNLIEEVNLTAAEMLRVERSGLKRQKFTQYIVPDYQDVFYLHRKSVFDTNSRQTCELRFMRKDGNQFDAQLISVPCQSPDGSFNHLRMAVTDITERKQMEEALRREKDFAESLTKTAQAIMLVLDTNARIVDFNPYMEKISGYRLEEIKGKDWFDTFLPKADHSQIREVFKKAISDIQTKGNVNPIITKDGREVLIEWYDKTLKDKDGQVIGLFAVGQDITERKKAEEAMHESERKFRETVVNLDEGFYSVTLDGVLLEHNQAFNRIMGFDSSVDLKGTHLPDFWQNPAERNSYLQEFAAKGFISNYQVNAKKKTGEKITVLAHAHLVKDKDNRPLRIEGIFLDITERKKAEEVIKNLAKFPEENSNPVYRTSKDGVLLYANPASRRLILGNQIKIGDKIPEKWIGMIKNVYDSGKQQQAEMELSGRVFLFDMVPIIEGGYVNSYATDITERKKTEQTIQHYQKRLKSLASRLSLSKEHEKQKIASGLHDNICQRLALSKFNLQLSIKSISDAETLNSLTNICVEIDNIIKDIHLLTFELSNPVLNELGLTAAVEKYLAEEIQEKHGIRFELNSNLKNKELTATIRGCLYRNTHELLWNIVKHARAHQVKVLIHKSADHINVCVEDDGIGFDTGRIAMLPTRNEGFGLFSIREQLEYLGGNIRIESNVGGGTKVTMTLPLKSEESVHL
jgi:PAS domain S-box-containing protein